MFLIKCPYCGERDQSEFSCGGEAHIVRPENPPNLTDDQWADYLFMKKNITNKIGTIIGSSFSAHRLVKKMDEVISKYLFNQFEHKRI